jgi:CheY-like chemotaxis protein
MMTIPNFSNNNFKLSFKVFYELMAKRVQEVLLVSSPYDAFMIEEDESLAVKIIDEYRGLNLTRPPRFTWVTTAVDALKVLSQKKIELVLTMPRIDDIDPFILGREIKKAHKNIPVFLLSHDISKILMESIYENKDVIDKVFVWSGSTHLLMTIIKSVEDMMNVELDTKKADVRTIIIVEDSPEYYSFLLPLLYKEIITQTRMVMEDSLNKEHQFLRMRARPKLLLAQDYEEAEKLYEKYKEYMLCVISDVRFPKNDTIDDEAGIKFLTNIREESSDIPLLMLSSEEKNRKYSDKISAVFFNKNSLSPNEIHSFLENYLGFGDFVFKDSFGKEICRVNNLAQMEKTLPNVPLKSIDYHSRKNDFSGWMAARSEIELVSRLKPYIVSDFEDIEDVRNYIIKCLKEARINRQKGIVVDFTDKSFDPDADFVKLGKGSLGGKARGLAFMSEQIHNHSNIENKFKNVNVSIPKTMVISTEEFDSFIDKNKLKKIYDEDLQDEEIVKKFLSTSFSEKLDKNLKKFLSYIKYPLAIRSSSLLEDAQYQPYAGIYKTYMIPNNSEKLDLRLRRLKDAIKLVYASTYFAEPKAFSKNTLNKTKEEKMAVVIQQIIGRNYDGYFYPAISGVAQSYNFYPIAPMRQEDGIAHIAAGLGKIVVEGMSALRFSPKFPQIMPQFSILKDILNNAQKFFYGLNLKKFPEEFGSAENARENLKDDVTLEKIKIYEFQDIPNISPVKKLCGTYYPEDNIIRDGVNMSGYPVLTFANILKYKEFPLPEILIELLEMGYKGMGCHVEIEFAVNFPKKPDEKSDEKYEFSVLQIRPMAKIGSGSQVTINKKDRNKALCFSDNALGNGVYSNISDIVFVDPDRFNPAQTTKIALEINKINKTFDKKGKKYLLIGSGRWGTADRWLGIPVAWNDISKVGAIIEVANKEVRAEASCGSHFFHNITSLGISYLTIEAAGFIDWKTLKNLPFKEKLQFVTHVELNSDLIIKIDGKKSQGVVLL